MAGCFILNLYVYYGLMHYITCMFIYSFIDFSLLFTSCMCNVVILLSWYYLVHAVWSCEFLYLGTIKLTKVCILILIADNLFEPSLPRKLWLYHKPFITFLVAMIPRSPSARTIAARVGRAEVRMNPVIVECGANERWLLGSPLGALSPDESSIRIPALGSSFTLTTLMTNTSQLSCNYLTQENQTSAGLYDRWQTCQNCKTAASWPGAPHLVQHITFIWHVTWPPHVSMLHMIALFESVNQFLIQKRLNLKQSTDLKARNKEIIVAPDIYLKHVESP